MSRSSRYWSPVATRRVLPLSDTMRLGAGVGLRGPLKWEAAIILSAALRRPRPTAVLSDDVRRRDLRQSWTSPNYPDHLSCMLCSLPRWIGSGALIGCPLPCTVRPSPLCRRVGIHNLLSRPAQASRGYGLQDCSPTIRGLYHEAPSYAGFPVSNARQLPSPTDNYLGGSFPHWCSTPLGRTA